jgi:hypothetical protein
MREVGYQQAMSNHASQSAERAQTQANRPVHSGDRSDDSEQEWEEHSDADLPPVSHTSTYGDGPEFSSEAMPAAFSACLFLGLGLLICLLLAFFL